MLAFKIDKDRLRDGWLALAARTGAVAPLRILAQARRDLARERFEQADRLLRSAVRRFPRDLGLRVQFAMNANARGRSAEALPRWRAVQATWPDLPTGWCGVAGNLRELGRDAEAWAVIGEAGRRFPDEPAVLLEIGRVADRLRLAEEGLAASRRLMTLQPGEPRWVQNHVERLLDRDRVDEARGEVGRALAADPHSAALRALVGLVAARRGAWDEAAAAWDAVGDLTDPGSREAVAPFLAALKTAAWRTKFTDPGASHAIWSRLAGTCPDDPDILDGRADALIRLGRLDDAAPDLDRALRLHPVHRGLRMTEALLAAKRGQWDDVIAQLTAILARYPDDDQAREALSRATMEVAFARAGAPDTPPVVRPQDVGLVRDDAVRTLLLGFESLGQDCEFGLVQRRFGAEPLGLFRWNSVSVHTLTDAVEAGLEGLGDPEHTRVSLWADAEYYVTDTRWHFGMHTFTTRHEMAEDVIHRKMCARLAYLRDKFLDDLRDARKTCVLKQDGVDLPTLERLRDALRAFGPVRLLCVQPLSRAPDAVRGTIRTGRAYRAGDDLLLGFVPKLGNGVGRWDIQFDDWVSICRSSLADDGPAWPA